MKYLLDTNAVIAVIADNKAMISRLEDFHPSDFGVSSIVMHELFSVATKANVSKETLPP